MELHHTKARRISLFRALHVIMVSSYEDYKIVPLHTYIFFCVPVLFRPFLFDQRNNAAPHPPRAPPGGHRAKQNVVIPF
jgi:hypothetical protein